MKCINFIVLIAPLFFILCSDDSKSPTEPQNTSPIVTEIIISPTDPKTGCEVTCNAIATDEDGDLLTYNWSASGGLFYNLGVGNPIVWIAPDQEGTYEISCIVNDGKSIGSKMILVNERYSKFFIYVTPL